MRARTIAGAAAPLLALLALTACDSGGDDEAQGPDPTPEETTVAVTDAAAVQTVLDGFAPGGAAPGENPYADPDLLTPVTACYELVADEDDGELLNGFYGEVQVNPTWVSVVVAADAETASDLTAPGVELAAGCAGTVADNPMIQSESVDSGSQDTGGTEAGWSVMAVEAPSGTIHDAMVVTSVDNLVVSVVSSDVDPAVARDNALAHTTELVEALAAAGPQS